MHELKILTHQSKDICTFFINPLSLGELVENERPQIKDRGGSAPQMRHNVPNLGGSSVMLGTLYDGRTDSLLVPLNLWSPEVVDEKKSTNNVAYSNTDFKNNEDILERLDVMGIEAELKLSFMGGLIQVYVRKNVHCE